MRILIDKLPELKAKLVEINSNRPSIVRFDNLEAYELSFTDYVNNVRALEITISEAENQVIYQKALDLLGV